MLKHTKFDEINGWGRKLCQIYVFAKYMAKTTNSSYKNAYRCIECTNRINQEAFYDKKEKEER